MLYKCLCELPLENFDCGVIFSKVLSSGGYASDGLLLLELLKKF